MGREEGTGTRTLLFNNFHPEIHGNWTTAQCKRQGPSLGER